MDFSYYLVIKGTEVLPVRCLGFCDRWFNKKFCKITSCSDSFDQLKLIKRLRNAGFSILDRIVL